MSHRIKAVPASAGDPALPAIDRVESAFVEARTAFRHVHTIIGAGLEYEIRSHDDLWAALTALCELCDHRLDILAEKIGAAVEEQQEGGAK